MVEEKANMTIEIEEWVENSKSVTEDRIYSLLNYVQ